MAKSSGPKVVLLVIITFIVCVIPGCRSDKAADSSNSSAQAAATNKPKTPLDELRAGSGSEGSTLDDAQIGEASTEPPRQMSPVEDGGGFTATPNGLPLFDQFFLFDPTKKEVDLASGSDLPGGMNTQGTFGNKLIDSVHFKRHKRLHLGTVLVSTARTKFGYGYGCADVGLSFENHSKILISPNYVASPAEPEASQPTEQTGHSVVVFFEMNARNRPVRDGSKPITGPLNVSRNGSPPVQFSLPPSSTSDIDNIPLADTGLPIVELWNVHRRTDVIEWNLEDEGKIAYKGAVGFPVVGTVPKLVYYHVDVFKNTSR